MAEIWHTVLTHRLLGLSTLSLSLFVLFGFIVSFFILRTVKDFGRYFSRSEEKTLLNQLDQIELLPENPLATVVPPFVGGLQVSSYIDENEPMRIAQTITSNTTAKGDALEDLVVRIYQGLGYEAKRVDKMVQSGEITLAPGSNDGGGDVLVIFPPNLELLPRKVDDDGSLIKDEYGQALPMTADDYPSETDYHRVVERTRRKHLIQCKAFGPDVKLDSKPIQEVHLAKSVLGADTTEVITTAEGFTAPAVERGQAVDCKLTDRAGLVELIRQHNKVLADILKNSRPA